MSYSNHRSSDNSFAGLELLKSALASSGAFFAYFILFLIGAYSLLHQSDRLPLLSFPELCWNLLVYITPPSVVLALDKQNNQQAGASEIEKNTYSTARTFAAKSQAMMRILGLSGAGVLTNVHRARSLSGLSSIFKSIPNNALPGLGNWDNSCYQNSILQGLSSLPSLYKFLQTVLPDVPGDDSWSTNDALKFLIEELNSSKNLGSRIWTPPALKNMSSWQQQDAQEYYSKVVDEMEKEIAKTLKIGTSTNGLGIKNVGLGSLKQAARSPKKTITEGVQRQESTISPSPVQELPQAIPESSSSPVASKNPLEGLLAQRVGCLQCGFVEGLSLIPFNCLTVPLGRSFTSDIRSCLDDYTTLESISGVECANCTLLRTRDQLTKLLDAKEEPVNEGLEAEYKLVGPIRELTQSRLESVEAALSSQDFSEATLAKKCMISSKNRVNTTKSRQAVVARPPRALVIHVNRSMFDELTGMMSTNYASVEFPMVLDISAWCQGVISPETATESWITDPARSMLASSAESFIKGEFPAPGQNTYVLRAVVTHYGRHENGHYIAYRQAPSHGDLDKTEGAEGRWWRLSDEDVSLVSEENVLGQGGVFMLFYERANDDGPGQSICRQGNATTGHGEVEAQKEPSELESSEKATSKIVSQVSNVQGALPGEEKKPVRITRTEPTMSSTYEAAVDAPKIPMASGVRKNSSGLSHGDAESSFEKQDSERNALLVGDSKTIVSTVDDTRVAELSKWDKDSQSQLPFMRTSKTAATGGQEQLSKMGKGTGLVQAV